MDHRPELHDLGRTHDARDECVHRRCAGVSARRPLRVDHRAAQGQHLQGRRHVPERDHAGRPELGRREALRSLDAARVHILRRADVAIGATVWYGPAGAVVHQFILGHRARWDCLDAFLRQRRLSAARRCAHVSAAVGDWRRLVGSHARRSERGSTAGTVPPRGRRYGCAVPSHHHEGEGRDRDLGALSVSGAHGVGRQRPLHGRRRAYFANLAGRHRSLEKHLLVALERRVGVHAGRLRDALHGRIILIARAQR